jgi:integrase
MNDIEKYLQAATRDNTRRSYRSAIEHFEDAWGGFLPATADSIARYLTNYADSLAFNSLKQRLAALAQWHIDQGFPDPTKAPLVKKVLKGIRELHPQQEKQAKPFQLDQLQILVHYIDQQIDLALQDSNSNSVNKLRRDKALVLIGFWRGFRSDELRRLMVENVEVIPGEGMTLYLPRSKSDRNNLGKRYQVPALAKLCPVDAYIDWVTSVSLQKGPVFRRIDRWGNVGDDALHANSFIPLLRNLFQQAGIAQADEYSSHSLRRGFASWANTNDWDVKALMEYIGWKDVKTALRYIDAVDSSNQFRIEATI